MAFAKNLAAVAREGVYIHRESGTMCSTANRTFTLTLRSDLLPNITYVVVDLEACEVGAVLWAEEEAVKDANCQELKKSEKMLLFVQIFQ